MLKKQKNDKCYKCCKNKTLDFTVSRLHRQSTDCILCVCMHVCCVVFYILHLISVTERKVLFFFSTNILHVKTLDYSVRILSFGRRGRNIFCGKVPGDVEEIFSIISSFEYLN